MKRNSWDYRPTWNNWWVKRQRSTRDWLMTLPESHRSTAKWWRAWRGRITRNYWSVTEGMINSRPRNKPWLKNMRGNSARRNTNAPPPCRKCRKIMTSTITKSITSSTRPFMKCKRMARLSRKSWSRVIMKTTCSLTKSTDSSFRN